MIRWRPPPAPAEPQVVTLTARQADVLALIAVGLSNSAIADRLYLSEDTVKTHLRRIYAALSARSRAHAVSMACTGQVAIYVNDHGRSAA